ncbi:MAG: hypothetical protein U1F54_09810 [Burkholderiales bacterium]
MGTKDDAKDNVHGEGNYAASRQYNEATKRFVESGRVEQAAREAAPHDAREAAEMKQAEQAALLRAKESPPMKEPPARKLPIEDPAQPDERKREAGSEANS